MSGTADVLGKVNFSVGTDLQAFSKSISQIPIVDYNFQRMVLETRTNYTITVPGGTSTDSRKYFFAEGDYEFKLGLSSAATGIMFPVSGIFLACITTKGGPGAHIYNPSHTNTATVRIAISSTV